MDETIKKVYSLTRGDGFVSKFDLTKVCGLTEYEIKTLVGKGNLTRIKRGCYEFKVNIQTWNDVIQQLNGTKS